MPNDAPPGHDPELGEKIEKIIEELIAPQRKGRRGNGLIRQFRPDFDDTRPTQHESKAAFVREEKIVKAALKSSRSLVRALAASREDTTKKKTLAVLNVAVNDKLRFARPVAPVDNASDLIRRMIADTNGFDVTLWAIIDLHVALRARQEELDEQRDKFWNVPNRPPDYYARAIASRLAKRFAEETGERPTSGTSPIDGGPSTAFTQALKKIFDLLGIKSGTRSPADWAIEHLTEEDLNPPRNALAELATPQAFGGNALAASLNLLKV